MSQDSLPLHGPWHRRMVARDVTDPHRSATPLELFFDLCFVIAVAQAGSRLHHAIADGHAGQGVLSYLMVFFAIWWAWMNITWFASAYDPDDLPFRLATFVQIAGALIFAAGIPRAFDEHDFTVITLGYLVMRTVLVANWLRAAVAHPAGRKTALRFAAGVTACQFGWLSLLALPDGVQPWGWLILIPGELAVPVWAELAGRTAWHPRHIAERYGLFTIIVLGESTMAATLAVQTALDDRHDGGVLYELAVGGALTMFGMWSLYFAKPAARFLTSNRAGFVWGYGHYLIFGSAAAAGAGLLVVVDHATHHADLPATAAAAAFTVPVVVFLVTVAVLQHRPHHLGWAHSGLPVGASILVLATTFTGHPVLLTGLVLAMLVGSAVLMSVRRPATP